MDTIPWKIFSHGDMMRILVVKSEKIDRNELLSTNITLPMRCVRILNAQGELICGKIREVAYKQIY
jgi:hypothetical protein